MNMELVVDSKPKQHPSARICRQMAPPAARRRNRERDCRRRQVVARLLAGHGKAIGAKDFHPATPCCIGAIANYDCRVVEMDMTKGGG
jgi:hypothetical protein